MKKRILLDASTVTHVTDGLSQYIINIIRHFPPECAETFDVSVLVNPDVDRPELHDAIRLQKFSTVTARIRPIGPRRDLDMWRFYRANKESFDVFHSTSNQYPLCIPNGIATIHDITFRYFFDKPWYTFRLAQRYLGLVIGTSLRRAKHVIAVSNSTREMLIDAYRLSPKQSPKISVIYEGWEHLAEHPAPARNNETTIEGRYLFYAGTSRKHKNMKRLLAAFEEAVHRLPPDVKLVVSGSDAYLDKDDRRRINNANLKETKIIFTGYVSDAALAELFSNCTAFIFPSLCEGFGIPVLEAFYFKKPLLCSDATSLPEVAGDAALYFDPRDVSSIAKTMIGFFLDPALGPQLAAKGEVRLLAFSWKKAARETFELYRRHFDL